MKVLVIDDNPDDRRLMRYNFEHHDCVVIEAGDGQQGLETALQCRPDIIVSDALMPRMDGFQLLRELKKKKETQRIPFVFYSATYTGDREIELAASLGAEAFIVKPKEPEVFWDELSSIIEKCRAEREQKIAVDMIEEDRDYLSRYSQIVATKLEEKIRELEVAKAKVEESEAFVRKILETVDEGFIVVDREYRILAANKAFCLYARLPEEQVVGQFCYQVSHHVDRPCFEAGEKCGVKRVFETGTSQAVAHTHTGLNGEACYAEIRAYPIMDASGNIVSAIETITDVTEKKKLEEQLRHAQKLEALGTLAGGVAHDFNNIISVIVGYGGIMEMRMPDDDPNTAYLREILAASERATLLTESLLIFSRKQIAELRPVSINDLVNGMKRMVFRIIGEDIETDIRLTPEKLTVMGDYGQLEQVLMNFATNARDAMPDGGSLTIETEPLEMDDAFIHRYGFGKPGKYALISVTDTGAGMDEQTRERIFEPFFTTKKQGKGTGLGLSIVYGIIKQHNGHIHCLSEQGRGTTFRVYLPLVEEVPREKAKTVTAPLRGGSESILVADDDENIRKLIRALLEQHGYSVFEAKDGAEALIRFQENRDRIDLVLLDVIMPRKGGREVYDEMRAMRPDVKTLFMSGYTSDVIEGKKILEERLQLLHKPVRPRELLNKIREMLDGRQQEQNT